MFEQIPILYEVLWATFGLVLYKIISRFYEYSRLSTLTKNMITRCLVLIGVMIENLAFTYELKYKTMKENNIDQLQIDVIKEIDTQTIETWKAGAIASIISCFPREFRSMIGFSTWDEAVKKVDEYYKREGR